MGQFLRKRVEGGTYFFTAVTCHRRHILTSPQARGSLRLALKTVADRWSFELLGIVLLPDHVHTIWVLPSGDANYPLRWQKLKEHFTRRYLAAGGREGSPSDPKRRHGERAVWQRRYWEHTCRNDRDLKQCLDYLHWNPVKHGLVRRVADWPWSSFHRFVRLGEYPPDWGGENPCGDWEMPE